MPTKRSISFLKSKLLQPALTSQFEVEIPLGTSSKLNSILRRTLGGDGQTTLNINCAEASLPGSSLATFKVDNDHTGVTETFAHRKMYDDRIDFTFYVDAQEYLPIRFFETWMRYIAGEDDEGRSDGENIDPNSIDPRYHYRMRYPDGASDGYRCDGLTIKKFERSHRSQLQYNFVKSFPIAVNSMPVSYDSSNLMKCTVSMSYMRYYINELIVKDRSNIRSQSSQFAQFGNTAGPGTAFAERDSATGARLDGVSDPEPITTRQALGLDPI